MTNQRRSAEAACLPAGRGDGWVFLDWKAPDDGEKVSAYLSACEPAQAGKIQRREQPEGAWQDVATAIETEATLVDQPKGKELEPVCVRSRTGRYRVIAINKSGEGSPSNTVMVVL